MSDEAKDPRADAQRELAIGKMWLDRGDVQHAAAHIAQAIAADPSLPEPYAQIESLCTDRNLEDLFPPGESIYVGFVAARAHLAVRRGKPTPALRDIVNATLSMPDRPWTATAWWPELPAALDPAAAGQILARLAASIPRDVDIAMFTPFLDLANALSDRHPGDVDLAVRMAGLARRLGAAADGDRWCARAEAHTPGPLGSIMLGYALRDAERYYEMEAAWQRAVDADPTNVDPYIDFARTYVDLGQRDAGQRWLRRALAVDADHWSAVALRTALASIDSDSATGLIRLADDARDAGRTEALVPILTTACHGRSWLNYVPMPTEVTALMLRTFAAERAKGKTVTITQSAITAIEPPSVVAAAQALLPECTWTVMDCPAPDLRLPQATVAYRVWQYDGTTPTAAVAAPSAAAADALRETANLTWTDPVSAYVQAARLADVSLGDLLGLIGHMPTPPDNTRWRLAIDNPVYWPRLAVAWTCLGLLHHRPDEPWATSTRRRVLLDLVNGIEDWTTDSALFACVVAAWHDPQIRDDVHGIVRARLDLAQRTSRQRLMTIAPSIAALMRITPGAQPADIAVARQVLSDQSGPARRSSWWRRLRRSTR